jgi:hypothetical protein
MQMSAYKANVPTGVKNSIMGRKVRPIRVLDAQFVAVARAEPRERTERGKSLFDLLGKELEKEGRNVLCLLPWYVTYANRIAGDVYNHRSENNYRPYFAFASHDIGLLISCVDAMGFHG